MGGYGHTASTRGHPVKDTAPVSVLRWYGAGVIPAAPRMKQADIYSILNPNLSLQPPSGKDSTPGNAAAPPCPALSLQLPAHFSGSLRANFDGFKSKHTAPGRPFLFVSEGFNPDQSS